MEDNLKNDSEFTDNNFEIHPENKDERMLVLGIKTLLNSDFAKNIGGAINKFAQSEIEKTTIEKIKATTREKEIELDNKKIELEKQKIDTLKIFDKRNKINDLILYLIAIAIFIIAGFLNIIDNKALFAFLTLLIGFYSKNNWNDIVKLFSKKD